MNKNAGYLLSFENTIINEFEEESSALYNIAALENIRGRVENNKIIISYKDKDVNPNYGLNYSAKEAVIDFVKCYRHNYSKLSKYKIYKIIK